MIADYSETPFGPTFSESPTTKSNCFLSPPTDTLSGLPSGDFTEKLSPLENVLIDLPLLTDLLFLALALDYECMDALETNLPSSLEGYS